jgi:hypothetical protein
MKNDFESEKKVTLLSDTMRSDVKGMGRFRAIHDFGADISL